jgi:hypothetical protein
MPLRGPGTGKLYIDVPLVAGRFGKMVTQEAVSVTGLR